MSELRISLLPDPLLTDCRGKSHLSHRSGPLDTAAVGQNYRARFATYGLHGHAVRQSEVQHAPCRNRSGWEDNLAGGCVRCGIELQLKGHFTEVGWRSLDTDLFAAR